MLSDKQKQDIRALRGTPLFPILVRVLTSLRDDERSNFERNPATEYGRGRVSALNDVLSIVSNSRS